VNGKSKKLKECEALNEAQTFKLRMIAFLIHFLQKCKLPQEITAQKLNN